MSDEVAWRYRFVLRHTSSPAVWRADRIATDDYDTYPQTLFYAGEPSGSQQCSYSKSTFVSFKIPFQNRLRNVTPLNLPCLVKTPLGANRAGSPISNKFDFSGKFDGSDW